MQDYSFDVSTSLWRRIGIFLLSLISATGYIIGTIVASKADSILFPLMRMAVDSRVSIVGLLFTILLPFFFSAVALLFSKQWIFLLLSFCKSFSFGFCACVLQLSFDSAAWIVQLLFLFTDGWILFGLFWFWIRYLYGLRKTASRDTLVYFVTTALICGIDYYLVSPFLAILI